MTIRGVPGVGKTRLARALTAGFESCVVPLAEAERLEDVALALQAAAGSEARDEASFLALGRALADEVELLVLDGAEQLRDELAGALPALLEGLAGTPVLITARRALDLPEERTFELGFLDPRAARELFLDRARRLDPRFAPDDDAVDDVVRALEGWPLALELAAGRAVRLGMASLDPGGASTDGQAFTALDRAIAWSWDQLDELESAALARLSALPLTWGRAQLEALLAPLGPPLELAERLRERSLLVHEPPAGTRVPRAVQRTGRARLDDSTLDALLARLAETLPVPDAPAAFGRPPTASAPRGLAHALLERALDRDDRALLERAWLALRPTYLRHGPYASWERLLGRVRDAVGVSTDPDGPDLMVRSALAELHGWRGRFAEAERLAAEILADVRSRGGHRELETVLLVRRGNALAALQRVDEGMACFDEAQRTAPPGRPALAAHLERERAQSMIVRDPTRAEAWVERALSVIRDLGDADLEAEALRWLAACRLAQGAVDAARDALSRAEALGGEPTGRHAALLRLTRGVLHHVEGALDDAEADYRAVETPLAEAQVPLLEGALQVLRGERCLEEGDDRAAEARLAHGLELLRPLGEPLSLSWALAALGVAHARRHRLASAERLLEDAHAVARRVDVPGLTAWLELRAHELALGRNGGRGAIEDARNAARPAEDTGGLVRVAMRLARRSLRARLERMHDEPSRPGLTVGPESRWFVRSDGEPVDLRRRPRLAMVLEAIVSARLADDVPGGWLSLDDLFATAWPGERAVAGSDRNRVYVSLSRLRRLGMDGLLESFSGRVRIAPEASVARADEASPPDAAR